MKHLQNVGSNVSVFWTTIAITALEGLAGVWWLSERLQDGIGLVIVNASDGTPLDGRYKINIWIIFIVITIVLILFIICLALIRELKLKFPEDKYAIETKEKYDDVLRRVGNFIEKVNYKTDIGRIAIIRLSINYIVEPDGTANVTKTMDILAKQTAFLSEIWVEADEESDPIDSYRMINFRANDKTVGTELDWLPSTNNTRLKHFVILRVHLKHWNQILL